VSKTLGKGYYTLGKCFTEFNTRQRFHRQRVLCQVFFFGHSAKTLPSVKKHSAKKNTRQIKNRKNKKNSKTFLNSRNNSPTLPYYLTRCPIIFHYYFESNLYDFVNGEIRTRNLSLAHTLLYHYTTTPIMFILRFHSPCTITNRE
jgi:hypothetical protein